ncbi:head GIN domain-containing protein [Patescibacteria group bacterium]
MKRFSDVMPGIIIALIVIIGALFFWYQQGDFISKGEIIGETRDVAGFDKVSISGSGLVMVKQSQEESLKIVADEKLMEYIITKVVNEELQISYKKDIPSSLMISGVKFYMTVKDLEKIILNGSAKLESSTLSANELELVISGSGRMTMNLEVENLVADLNGSGKFELEGMANQQQVKVSGSGGFYGKKLEGKEGEVTLAGSGKVEINTVDKLDISISGSGSVYYLGGPVFGEVDVSGSGGVKKL